MLMLRALRALRGKTVFQKFAQAATNFKHALSPFPGAQANRRQFFIDEAN
jgi:hypothetical protein